MNEDRDLPGVGIEVIHPGADPATPAVLEEDGRHPGGQPGSFSCVERAQQTDGVQDRIVRLERAQVEGVEHDPGRLAKRKAAVDQLVQTVAAVLLEHASKDIRIFDDTVPSQGPFDGMGERTSLCPGGLQRMAQNEVVACEGLHRVGTFELPCLAPGPGLQMRGSDQAIEHLDGEIGESGLPFYDEGDENGRSPRFADAHQLARLCDLGLACDHGVAIGMDTLAPIIRQTDRPDMAEA